MAAAGLDALLVMDKYNYWYLTGHLSREFDRRWRPMLFVLPRVGTPRALVFAPESGALANASGAIAITTYDDAPVLTDMIVQVVTAALPHPTARLGAELGDSDRLGMGYLAFAEFRARLPEVGFVDASPVLAELRQIKTAAELALIARAAAIALAAWEQALPEFRVGLRNDDVRDILGAALCRAGSDFNLPGHVTVGNRVAGEATAYRRGDVLWCDFGASYRGYQSDIARRAVFGRASVAQLAAHGQAVAMIDAMIDACHPGAKAAAIAKAASDMMMRFGHAPLAGRRRIGHGIGLAAAESPSLGLFDRTELQPGMVLTPEPAFDLAGGELVHIEEMVAITSTGARRLTAGAEILHELDA
jgi:Xaa-Pro aminopeptidase